MSILERQVTITQVDADFFFNVNRDIIKDKFNIDATFGINKNTQRSDRLDLRGSRFIVPFLEILGNVQDASRERRLDELALAGIYGSIGLSYNNYLFLNFTGRNDWFSTLSAADKTTPNNEFYPAVNGSFVFSEAFEMPEWLSFGKIRTGYSEVAGGSTTPYLLGLPFEIFGQQHLGQPLGRIATGTVPNLALTPFTKKEFEIGFDLRLFQNRVGIDFAYYSNSTVNDIVNVAISNASGFQTTASNIGQLDNNGFELLLNVSPIQNINFNWNTSLNVTYNVSEVVATDEQNNDLSLGDVRTFDATIRNIVGQPFGTIFGTSYARNDNGTIIYDSQGRPFEVEQ